MIISFCYSLSSTSQWSEVKWCSVGRGDLCPITLAAPITVISTEHLNHYQSKWTSHSFAQDEFRNPVYIFLSTHPAPSLRNQSLFCPFRNIISLTILHPALSLRNQSLFCPFRNIIPLTILLFSQCHLVHNEKKSLNSLETYSPPLSHFKIKFSTFARLLLMLLMTTLEYTRHHFFLHAFWHRCIYIYIYI